jgi:hypothetical protein
VVNNRVVRFKRNLAGEYEYDCQIDGWSTVGTSACVTVPNAEERFLEPVGAFVDSSGNVYISSFGPGEGFVAEFDSSGKSVARIGASEHALLGGHPEGLAVDMAGDLFVQNFIEVPAVHEERIVAKFTFGNAHEVTSESKVIGPVGAIAIDHTTNEIYVKNQSGLREFNVVGEELPALFGALPLGGVRGIAVRHVGASPEVDVASEGSAESLGLITVPDVGKCRVSNVTQTSARLEAEINPLNAPGSLYRFEYRSPQEESATSFESIEGNGARMVSTEIEGLVPGTSYHCRASATDTAGINSGFVINKGEESTFETFPDLPVISLCEATHIAASSAVLGAMIEPGNGFTTYHFEYGTTSSYGTQLPSVGAGGGFAPFRAEEYSGIALAPETEYHYSLLAENRSGRVVGPDCTFVTLPAVIGTVAPGVAIGAAIDVTSTGAVLSGTVVPHGSLTGYRFQIGPTTAYGTEIPGQVEAGASAEGVSTNLADLSPGTVYHYKLIATNAGGTVESGDATFVTPPATGLLVAPSTLALVNVPPFPSFTEKPVRPRCVCPKRKKRCTRCPMRKKSTSKHNTRRRGR